MESDILIKNEDDAETTNSITQEQQNIVEVGNSLTKTDPRIFRVIAGAGTGMSLVYNIRQNYNFTFIGRAIIERRSYHIIFGIQQGRPDRG
jgi:hypothetical protein